MIEHKDLTLERWDKNLSTHAFCDFIINKNYDVFYGVYPRERKLHVTCRNNIFVFKPWWKLRQEDDGSWLVYDSLGNVKESYNLDSKWIFKVWTMAPDFINRWRYNRFKKKWDKYVYSLDENRRNYDELFV